MNPMTSPNTKYLKPSNMTKIEISEDDGDPFQMSVSASAVPGSHAGGGGNLLSSRLDSSMHNVSQNLSSLIWQVPYDQRKSILA